MVQWQKLVGVIRILYFLHLVLDIEIGAKNLSYIFSKISDCKWCDQ
jgi:hypothetical protein